MSLKVAVCISGQSRAWKSCVKSFKNHFASDYDVKFFGHTWDENSWKTVVDGKKNIIKEKLDKQALSSEITQAFGLENVLVDKQLSGDGFFWGPPLKSAMIANHLKCKYEVENGFIFDVVVKTRWDLFYDPSYTFEKLVTPAFNPTVLYCHPQTNFPREFRLPAVDDIMYFGSSRVMDIMSNLYAAYKSGSFFGGSKEDQNNRRYCYVGCNALLHKWATMHNIQMLVPPCNVRSILPLLHHPIVRKESEHLQNPEDYDEVRRINNKVVADYNNAPFS